ncbi:MAG: hypothetical protein NTW87_13795 [Planctomycetota bacterium]|nr:hypothetical protein [Planctomycetota bacterium]
MRTACCAMILALSAAVVAGEDTVPPPPASLQKDAEKLIKEVSKEDYAKTKPEDKAALAKKLLKQAEETKDDLAAKYVLWREAGTLAAQGGDMSTALAAVDKMAAEFTVDAVALKKAALTTVGLVTRDAEQSRAIGGMRTLLDKPDDPAANLLVGKHWCFSKGDWSTGLPSLAKCSVPALKAAAEAELAKPGEAQAQVAAAEGWWDAAENETEKPAKAAMQARAKYWYQKALPSLTGLARVKAEKRLAAPSPEAATSKAPKPDVIFMAKKSMKPYPAKTQFGRFPVQDDDDATAVFSNKPVYFDQRTGKDVLYAVRSSVPLRHVRWKGAAMTAMTIEVLDADGSAVAKGGPYAGGNVWDEFTVEFEPRAQFYLRIRNGASTWLLISEIELK